MEYQYWYSLVKHSDKKINNIPDEVIDDKFCRLLIRKKYPDYHWNYNNHQWDYNTYLYAVKHNYSYLMVPPVFLTFEIIYHAVKRQDGYNGIRRVRDLSYGQALLLVRENGYAINCLPDTIPKTYEIYHGACIKKGINYDSIPCEFRTLEMFVSAARLKILNVPERFQTERIYRQLIEINANYYCSMLDKYKTEEITCLYLRKTKNDERIIIPRGLYFRYNNVVKEYLRKKYVSDYEMFPFEYKHRIHIYLSPLKIILFAKN